MDRFFIEFMKTEPVYDGLTVVRHLSRRGKKSFEARDAAHAVEKLTRHVQRHNQANTVAVQRVWRKNADGWDDVTEDGRAL